MLAYFTFSKPKLQMIKHLNFALKNDINELGMMPGEYNIILE